MILRAFSGSYVFGEKIEFPVQQLILLKREYFLWEEFAFSIEEQCIDRCIPVHLVDPFLKFIMKMIVLILP